MVLTCSPGFRANAARTECVSTRRRDILLDLSSLGLGEGDIDLGDNLNDVVVNLAAGLGLQPLIRGTSAGSTDGHDDSHGDIVNAISLLAHIAVSLDGSAHLLSSHGGCAPAEPSTLTLDGIVSTILGLVEQLTHDALHDLTVDLGRCNGLLKTVDDLLAAISAGLKLNGLAADVHADLDALLKYTNGLKMLLANLTAAVNGCSCHSDHALLDEVRALLDRLLNGHHNGQYYVKTRSAFARNRRGLLDGLAATVGVDLTGNLLGGALDLGSSDGADASASTTTDSVDQGYGYPSSPSSPGSTTPTTSGDPSASAGCDTLLGGLLAGLGLDNLLGSPTAVALTNLLDQLGLGAANHPGTVDKLLGALGLNGIHIDLDGVVNGLLGHSCGAPTSATLGAGAAPTQGAGDAVDGLLASLGGILDASLGLGPLLHDLGLAPSSSSPLLSVDVSAQLDAAVKDLLAAVGNLGLNLSGLSVKLDDLLHVLGGCSHGGLDATTQNLLALVGRLLNGLKIDLDALVRDVDAVGCVKDAKWLAGVQKLLDVRLG